jgi:hypothetical protein
VDLVPDPLLLRKCGSAGNRTRNLWNYSQELRPLDHRGSLEIIIKLFSGESVIAIINIIRNICQLGQEVKRDIVLPK